MRAHLFMAAAAASILLTSAALASNLAAVNGSSHSTRRADHFTVMTDNEELMCKVAGDQSSGSGAPPPAWAHAINHLHEEGDIRCTPTMANGL